MGLNNLKQLKSQAFNQLGKAGLNKFGLGDKLNLNFDSNGFKSISGNFNELIKKKQRGRAGQSPLRELYERDSKVKRPIVFPEDIDGENYMIFNVMDRKRPSRDSVIEERAMKSIVLPIPSSLNNQHSVGYNNENLGAIGWMASGKGPFSNGSEVGSATDIADLVVTKVKKLTSAFNKMAVETKGEKLAADQTTAGAAVGGATLAAAKVKGLGAVAVLGGAIGLGQIGKGLGTSEGIAVNPHTAVLFDNVNFREFQFSYKFIARNEKESVRITNIIDTFNYYMHPDVKWGGGSFFEYPEEWDIEFSTHLAPSLFKIGRCALKNVNVNYNGESIPIFFEDTGAPVSVEISLTFQELEIQTKQTLDIGWNSRDEAKSAAEIGVADASYQGEPIPYVPDPE